MSDIFISYARKDYKRAEMLGRSLEKHGWSVWLDSKLAAGVVFEPEIHTELDSARCVIVLWSNNSIHSRWVKREAKIGMERSILTPVLLDEDATIPRRFKRIHATNLASWKGSRRSEEYKKLIVDLENFLGKSPLPGKIVAMYIEHLRFKPLYGTPFSGEHLVMCLDKADPIRRFKFMKNHGIYMIDKGKYLIKIRHFGDGRMLLEKSNFEVPGWTKPHYLKKRKPSDLEEVDDSDPGLWIYH
jgi:hypothetical protein